MRPDKHPSDLLIMDFTAGRASEGARLAVSVHLADCRQCRLLVAALDELGGLVLNNIEPAPMGAAKAGDALRAAVTAQGGEPPPFDASAVMGEALKRLRWAGPGLALRSIPLHASPERAYLIRVREGVTVPHHEHTGRELVAVWAGGFSDGERDFTAGDFVETRRGQEHGLIAHPGAPCICLIVLEAPIQFKGVARWLQPILGL